MLDDYLANRLDEQQKSAFEQKLNSDSELRNEYQLQQELIAGIKKMRAVELKAMMNNIPVPSGTSAGTFGTKIALWSGVAVIIATGLYFYLSDEKTEQLPADTTVTQTEDPTPSVTPEQVTEKDEEASESSQEAASAEQKPSGTPKTIKKDSNETPVAAEPKIEVFDPSEEADQTVTSGSEAFAKNDVKVKDAPAIDVEIDSQNKKYNFHYQFKDGKLLLYGPFEKDLYEILEFFNDDKRTIFLFYNDQYYLLNEEATKLKPLNPITDKVLIKKLREYRNH